MQGFTSKTPYFAQIYFQLTALIWGSPANMQCQTQNFGSPRPLMYSIANTYYLTPSNSFPTHHTPQWECNRQSFPSFAGLQAKPLTSNRCAYILTVTIQKDHPAQPSYHRLARCSNSWNWACFSYKSSKLSYKTQFAAFFSRAFSIQRVCNT